MTNPSNGAQSYEELQEAAIAALERILFGDVLSRSRDELEARAQVYADAYEEAVHARTQR